MAEQTLIANWLCVAESVCVVTMSNLSKRLSVCDRMFWPKEIWGRYADSLADFKEPCNARQAVQCLNHMVTDALR